MATASAPTPIPNILEEVTWWCIMEAQDRCETGLT